MFSDAQVPQAKTPLQIIGIGRISAIIERFLQFLPEVLRRGLTGLDIQSSALQYFKSTGAKMALRGYKGFPQDISVSVNGEIAHGIPTNIPFVEGDLVKVDIVAFMDGYYSDCSWTYSIGKASETDVYLMEAAWKVARAAIAHYRAGNRFSDLAEAARQEAKSLGVHLLYQFVGHGIGTTIHEAPIVRFDAHASREKINHGTVVCVEPVVSLERITPKKLPDGRYIASHGKKTAVYEHVVAAYPRFSRVLSHNLCRIEEFPQLPPFMIDKKEVINY